MGEANEKSRTEFILVGFADIPNLRMPILVGSLLFYLVTIAANLLVMSVIYCDSHLHTPMYIFLINLSFADIWYTSVIFPKMMGSFLLLNPHVTLLECLIQLYFLAAMIVTEFIILTIMSFDRYMAICNPLHYTMIMNKTECFQMATGAWIAGLMEPIVHIVQISTFSFCKTLEIDHFFCDATALLKLSCTSTSTIDRVTFLLGGWDSDIFLMSFILSSYIKIISAILKIRNNTQRSKAFSTCASHLTVVILFYGVYIFLYMRPASMYSASQSKLLSLLYIGAIPLSNPIIYTVKNKEFKLALRRRRCCKC